MSQPRREPSPTDERKAFTLVELLVVIFSGANFVKADGSAHQIVYTIDSEVCRYLGNLHDGRSVQVPQ